MGFSDFILLLRTAFDKGKDGKDVQDCVNPIEVAKQNELLNQ